VSQLRRVGEESPVLVVHDVDREIRVGVRELPVELLVEGVVDRGPEGAAAGDDIVDVPAGRRARSDQKLAHKRGDKRAYRVGLVESSETTSLGRLARKAPRQLIVRGTCYGSIALQFFRR
jgi:hypothetical protein